MTDKQVSTLRSQASAAVIQVDDIASVIEDVVKSPFTQPLSEEAFCTILGEQAALISHHINQWFGLIQERLDVVSAKIDGRVARGGTYPKGSVHAPELPGASAAMPGAAPPVCTAPNFPPAGAAGASVDPILALGAAQKGKSLVLQRLETGGPGAAMTTADVGAELGRLPRPQSRQAPPPLRTSQIAIFQPVESWAGWRFHQAVKLLPRGVVELQQGKSTPGVESDPIAVPGSSLLRILIDCAMSLGKNLPCPHIRVHDQSGNRVTPEVALGDGVSEVLFFVPHTVAAIRVLIIAIDPRVGFQFALKSVKVETVDPESHYARAASESLAPLVASMATIPGRRRMLEDCVLSLLVQCDKVRVFLNEYPDVPAFLNHRRIEVRRSQDWDDMGDAGKFGWIDAADDPGYRIIVDDDLVFPPDFVAKITAKVNAYENRAIVGMHGVLLRQPVASYYDAEYRSVFHFQSSLRHDRTCHVLGTNALCYYSDALKMTWADFMFRNMADIFLARYAQEHRLAMVTPGRPQNWVRQNSQAEEFDTIYSNSLRRTRSKFDSSLIQDAVVKWIAPLTMQPSGRPKIVCIMVAYNVESFDALLISWESTRSLDYDWVLVLVAAGQAAKLRSHVNSIRSLHEVHVVDGAGTTGQERLNRAFSLVKRIECDLLCIFLDPIRFEGGGWTKKALDICKNVATPALFITASEPGTPLIAARPREGTLPAAALVGGSSFRHLTLDHAPGNSTRMVWDLMVLLSTAAETGEALLAFDLIAITRSMRIVDKLPAFSQVRESSRGRRPAAGGAPIVHLPRLPAVTINEFFQNVFVINLDRRPDRWAAVSNRLAAALIKAERWPAVDGISIPVAAEYAAYLEVPTVRSGPDVRTIQSSKQFYQDYDSQAARVAYAQEKDGRKAIASSGAWGYLKTWEQILEHIVEKQIRSALVLDDDVMFHRQTTAYFAAASSEVPDNWLLLQLGSLQYHWTADWISWRSRMLYQTNGLAVGSHAVGLKFDIAPFLLEHVKKMLLPFDTGALAAATRAFKDRCFVVYPNIAIQALQDKSDINTSNFQRSEGIGSVCSTYRWEMEHYVN